LASRRISRSRRALPVATPIGRFAVRFCVGALCSSRSGCCWIGSPSISTARSRGISIRRRSTTSLPGWRSSASWAFCSASVSRTRRRWCWAGRRRASAWRSGRWRYSSATGSCSRSCPCLAKGQLASISWTIPARRWQRGWIEWLWIGRAGAWGITSGRKAGSTIPKVCCRRFRPSRRCCLGCW